MFHKSWVLSDAFWEQASKLIPPPQRLPGKEYVRKAGGGRKRADDRQILAGIFYVLRTGCQWQAVPRKFGAPSTIHRRFLDWASRGFFEALWRAGLTAYDEMHGLEWEWQAIDGAMTKAPLGGEATGPNPTDRGKKRREAQPAGGRHWSPVGPRRQRGERS